MPDKKNQSYMTIEPMPKSSFTDKSLPSPSKPGMPSASIGPLDKAGPGWKAEPAIEHGQTKAPDKNKLTSLQKGGTAQYTGPHILHKGEQVIATDPQHSYQSTLRAKADILDKSGDKSTKAAQFRAKASAQDQYESHGANGNMIRTGSAARAPHDKD